MSLQVDVVSPEKILWTGEATMVKCRTIDGDIEFLDGHAPFLGLLGTGEFEVLAQNGERTSFAIDGGFVEVNNNSVILLVESTN
jgi:F-type H+-transporting ATPase subunit epsilon